jgi:raffinose/stachyose/melibiose transport system substrate-binding protein
MRITRWTAAATALVLVAAACGSDDDTSSDDATAGDTTAEETTDEDATTSDLEGTLRVLIHQNPPGVEFMENFNSEFEAANPGVTVDMSIVNADDIPTVNQTRLNAGDIDVTTISITGFANPVQPYMEGADTPYWQQLIEAGLVMDLTDQPFVQNYDQAAIDDGSVDGSVYGLNLGRTIYSGMFVNLDLLAEVGVEVPTTWDELMAACDAVEDAGSKCMIAGGQDAWPVFVGSYGLLGALYPDQQALVEGLWTGDAAWNDEQGMELFEKYAAYADRLDAESAGLTGDSAAQRYTAGDVAFGPMGAWNAGPIDDAAEFEWTYIPFPGSDDAADNQTLFGKYDMTFAVSAETPVEDIAMAYLAAFSEPDNYNAFANATNYLPTQPTASLDNTLGQATAPLLQEGNFTVGFEQWWVGPKGAGENANGSQAALWLYNGDFGDPVSAADTVQADLDAGL